MMRPAASTQLADAQTLEPAFQSMLAVGKSVNYRQGDLMMCSVARHPIIRKVQCVPIGLGTGMGVSMCVSKRALTKSRVKHDIRMGAIISPCVEDWLALGSGTRSRNGD